MRTRKEDCKAKKLKPGMTIWHSPAIEGQGQDMWLGIQSQVQLLGVQLSKITNPLDRERDTLDRVSLPHKSI